MLSDIACRPGPQQQTRRTLLQQSTEREQRGNTVNRQQETYALNMNNN